MVLQVKWMEKRESELAWHELEGGDVIYLQLALYPLLEKQANQSSRETDIGKVQTWWHALFRNEWQVSFQHMNELSSCSMQIN